MASKVRARLGQHELVVTSAFPAEEIRRAAERAEQATEPATDGRVALAAVRRDGLAYRVTGHDGLLQLTFAVTWSETYGDDGTRLVRLAVGDFAVARSRVLGLPVGPWTAPGLPSLARYADWLRKELDVDGAGPTTG